MSERIPGMPGPASHVAAALLALLLTLCVLLTGVGCAVGTIATDASLHEEVALSAPVRAAQRARIDGRVAALAQAYSFEPDTVNSLITDAALDQYNRDVIAWWMGLLGPEPTFRAPEWSAEGMLEAVMDDPLFKENTPSGRRKAIARDEVTAGVVKAVQESVLPLRGALVSLALSKVLPRIDVARYMAYVPYLPWAAAGAALLAAALTLLAMGKRPMRALAYIGGGLAAGGLCLLVLMAAMAWFDLPGQVAQVSTILCLQAETLLGLLGRGMALLAGACLALGAAMIALHQHAMMKLRRTLAQRGIPA